jgi:MFS family permease
LEKKADCTMENAKADAPTTRASKRAFFNLSVFEFLTFLRRGVFYTFMINYLFILMGTVTSTAALGTFNAIASSLGQNLLWGRISDRLKLRTRLIIAGETIAASAYILVFLVHRTFINTGNNFYAGLTIIIGLSCLEFFWSMSDVGWAALLTDITSYETRGKVIGAMNFIASLGRTAGILFAGFLYNDGQGFMNGTIFYIVTILLLIGAALMATTSRRVKTNSNVPRQPVENECKTAPPRTGSANRSYASFLISLIVIILGAASISQIFLLFINLKDGLNATDPQMSLILTAWTVGGMIASLAAGRFADKMGRTRVLLAGFTVAAITPLFYSLAKDVPSMATIYGLNGVSFWTIQTVGLVFAGDLIPKEKRGRFLGAYNAVMALSWGPAGILIGGPLADIQVERLHLTPYAAYTNMFYVSSAIVAIGTFLFAVRFARRKN